MTTAILATLLRGSDSYNEILRCAQNDNGLANCPEYSTGTGEMANGSVNAGLSKSPPLMKIENEISNVSPTKAASPVHGAWCVSARWFTDGLLAQYPRP